MNKDKYQVHQNQDQDIVQNKPVLASNFPHDIKQKIPYSIPEHHLIRQPQQKPYYQVENRMIHQK